MQRVTNEGNNRSPLFFDGSLYYIIYQQDKDSIMRLSPMSEPFEIATFNKIKKFVPVNNYLLVIALEKSDPKEPFVAHHLKYRYNASGLLRKRDSLYLRQENKPPVKIYGGNFDAAKVKRGGGE
ncbi:MAG: hypothetical protein QXU18_15305 [Thermoplasmatales archaeon]